MNLQNFDKVSYLLFVPSMREIIGTEVWGWNMAENTIGS
jgi:hypothetical protein